MSWLRAALGSFGWQVPVPVRAETEAAPEATRLSECYFGQGHGSAAAAGEGGLALGGDGAARGGVAGAHRDRLPHLAGALYPRRVQVRSSRGRGGVGGGTGRCTVSMHLLSVWTTRQLRTPRSDAAAGLSS